MSPPPKLGILGISAIVLFELRDQSIGELRGAYKDSLSSARAAAATLIYRPHTGVGAHEADGKPLIILTFTVYKATDALARGSLDHEMKFYPKTCKGERPMAVVVELKLR